MHFRGSSIESAREFEVLVVLIEKEMKRFDEREIKKEESAFGPSRPLTAFLSPFSD